MISVLIPIYNYDVRELVMELHRQMDASGITYEILCYDDGSEPVFCENNRAVAGMKNVRYLEMKKNLGRAKIRNRMSEDAQYEYLLFADCDSKIVYPDFIRNYFERANPSTVIFGGRCYRQELPDDKKKILHWRYGINRESLPAFIRQKEPYRLIMTNNFLVPRKVFLSSGLNEKVTGYGYEDSAFGFELQKEKIPVEHIDNPLLHTGIENNDVFLKKTENAIKNLSLLMSQGKIGNEVKIARCYKRLNVFPINYIILLFFLMTNSLIRKNLLSEHPFLPLFDLYRLGLLFRNFA